ncbi:hypothetical protein AVEN_261573-1 [Araneus ventricosus]|uniref:Tc1-like transposase DDE domain-containing protein n=1 Tax=Araneus ventricosus TaxID=182803 RepID=A0A4Y2EAT6_ARAVE|nr:hypothetical protein AVEN_261573-1 [Araneus ventricosus]
MNACCGEQKQNERLKLALHWTVSQRVSVVQTLFADPQFPEGVILQQDGAPPNYGNIVREFLDTTFPQWWIGRGAVMAWPPRSPDITPLDFYLWGYVK